ncbi:MAG TPA: PPC domain-containing protein, partial [Planctomycetaceae bacterium]|nr:PPC domain-containing protein [Planctomycetaceae bacterium]
MILSIALALLLGHCLTSRAVAAPPDIKTLLPAGGQRGTTTEITLGGKLEAGAQVWASRPGITAQIGEKGDTISLTVSAETLPGLCWLRFHNAEGASALRPFVIGVLPEVRETEPNDALKAALKIEAPATVANGVLAKNGDVDTYAVTLAKGQTFVASLTANNLLGSPMDGVLQLVSPRGFVIEQNNDDHGLDPQLVHTATEDGVYCVRVFAFPAIGDASLHFSGKPEFIYRLTLTTGPFADHAQPLIAKRDALTRVRLAGWNLPPDLLELMPVDAGANAAIFDARLANTLTLPWTHLPIVAE